VDQKAIVALNNRGTSLLRHGRQWEASRCLAVAAAASAPLSSSSSNFLLSLLYHPRLSPEQVAGAHAAAMNSPETGCPRPRGHRRLRVAYLTPDFHFHPIAFLHLPYLRYFDPHKFELLVYSSAPEPDAYTRQARAAAERWRNVAGKSPEWIAKVIRQDRVDILIDITGHFARSPLPVFALRPAPLQISIPGYPATTGLRVMDYKLVDRWTDPPGMTEHLYTEKLFRLGRPIACYAPPEDAPLPGRLPLETNGYTTFGCFNNRPKIHPGLMLLWVQILRRTGRSRLLFHHTFGGHREVTSEFRDPIARFFRSHGISSRRLDFVGGVPVADHLAAMACADIALDTFPYHGMTTTLEALWMGVPVLSLAGRAHASRAGVSILTCAGLAEWIVNTPEEYVERAVEMAGCAETVISLRAGLRDRLSNSALTDGAGFIRAVEGALVTLWRRSGS
jgi:protein O-GlcNAc transferase